MKNSVFSYFLQCASQSNSKFFSHSTRKGHLKGKNRTRKPPVIIEPMYLDECLQVPLPEGESLELDTGQVGGTGQALLEGLTQAVGDLLRSDGWHLPFLDQRFLFCSKRGRLQHYICYKKQFLWLIYTCILFYLGCEISLSLSLSHFFLPDLAK